MNIIEYKDKEFLQTLGKHYKEYYIENCSNIHRAKVCHGIKKGDIFNIYRGESRKEGCVWEGDLESSLLNHLKNEQLS